MLAGDHGNGHRTLDADAGLKRDFRNNRVHGHCHITCTREHRKDECHNRGHDGDAVRVAT